MSDCGVCLYAPEQDEICEFITIKTHMARKTHKCCECDKDIVPGEKYEYATGRFDGEFWTSKTCLVCSEIANAFYCDGRMYGGELWDQMNDVAFEEMTTGCLERLTTATAKAELIRRWNEWKFGRGGKGER